MDEVQTDILVIGAGPAGLAAAVNARRSGKRVAVTDENPFPGGQIWRPFRDFHGTKAQRQLVQLFHAEVPVFSSTTVFDFKGDSTASVISPRGYGEIHFERVVLATGAREQFLAFPGWTTPGVLGVGGLQAMLKQGLEVRGRRVVVAGSGPLLLAVAKSLSRHGARILNVFEQANTRSLRKFFFSLWGHPEKLLQAAGFYWTVQKLRPEWWVAEAYGGEKLEGVEVTNGWQRRRISCDLLACAYGLVPNTELAQLAGCRLKDGFVEVDEFQQTSQERFFCAGEPVGIGGVEAAEVQGAIAGLAAAGEGAQAERHFKARAKAAAFAENLAEAFVLREELRHLASDDTIVCRCEDVRWGAIKDFATFREAKLQARLGMGACQGRICGAACRVLRGWETPTVRPPLVPVPAEVLAKEGAT